jgi:hypothetical protein
MAKNLDSIEWPTGPAAWAIMVWAALGLIAVPVLTALFTTH